MVLVQFACEKRSSLWLPYSSPYIFKNWQNIIWNFFIRLYRRRDQNILSLACNGQALQGQMNSSHLFLIRKNLFRSLVFRNIIPLKLNTRNAIQKDFRRSRFIVLNKPVKFLTYNTENRSEMFHSHRNSSYIMEYCISKISLHEIVCER